MATKTKSLPFWRTNSSAVPVENRDSLYRYPLDYCIRCVDGHDRPNHTLGDPKYLVRKGQTPRQLIIHPLFHKLLHKKGPDYYNMSLISQTF